MPDNAHISSATDVWSLGCLLYAMAFGYSPFECSFYDSGVVRVVECTYLAVIGPVKFPKNCSYSPKFCEMIRYVQVCAVGVGSASANAVRAAAGGF